MKILMLVSHPGIAGPLPKITPLLVSSLQALGCDVVTLPWGRHRDGESTFDRLGGRVLDVSRVWLRLCRQRFDVMVVHTAHDPAAVARDLPLLLVGRPFCPAIVVHFHGSMPNTLMKPGWSIFKLATAALLRLCDGVLVLSREEQREWKRYAPRGKFAVVTNPYLSSSSRPRRDLSSAPPVLRVPFVVLFVGRVIAAKGVLDLIDALSAIADRVPWRLVVAGDGPDASRVRERIHDLGIAERVTLAGYLSGPQLTDAYGAADVFVLPTWWNEGFPTVISEAMDAGLPIITTRIRGAADHLVDGTHVLFVRTHDSPSLANALVYLVASPKLRAAMGQANRRKVRDFDSAVVGPTYLAVLEDIVRPRPTDADTLVVDA